MDLYQYVGNNPASYTDPFGLCADDDFTCWQLVRRLRQVGQEAEDDGKDGTVYKQAANRLAAWGGGADGTGRVKYGQVEEEPLYTEGGGIRRGMAPGHPESDGNFWISISEASGDFIVLAVHEIGHLDYTGHPPALVAMCKAAFYNLPNRYPAPRHRRAYVYGDVHATYCD